MHHFAYRDGVLHAEAVNLVTLAASIGTPFYCYSTRRWSAITGCLRAPSPTFRRSSATP
jgi:diaminopimelate decarboxylase